MIYSEEILNVCQGLTETDRVSTMLICFHEEKDGNLYSTGLGPPTIHESKVF